MRPFQLLCIGVMAIVLLVRGICHGGDINQLCMIGLFGMAIGTYGVSVSIGGISIQRSITRDADHPNPYSPSLPVGTAGTLTTRTLDTEGEVTLAAGHGLSSGTFDVYWTVSGTAGVQYGCTGVITGDTLSISAGSGDNLPPLDSAVVVSEQVPINTAIHGDAIAIMAICAEYPTATRTDPCHIQFRDSGAAEIAELDLVGNAPQVFDIEGGATNPFTGNPITVAYASNGSTAEAATLKIASLESSTS